MEVQIIDYQPQYRDDFKRLNEEWISHYFTLEPHDSEQLGDPQKYILSGGGRIFLALYGSDIIGTVALIKVSETSYELGKMAVSPKFQGLGIGKKLGMHLIEEAKKIGCKHLYLESNKKLQPALNLYRQLGFTEVPVGNTPYSRANFRAEMFF